MRLLCIGTRPDVYEMVSVALHLRWPDAQLLEAETTQQAMDMVEVESPDFVILQPDPDRDTPLTETIRDLRRFSKVPLMVWGNEGTEMEAVKALELGADDYVRPPCGFTELVARMVALMRRLRAVPSSDTPALFSGDLTVNPTTYEVYLGDSRISLTPTELRLLYALIRNRSVVVSRQFLERFVWEDRTESASSLKKHVQRLRKKLGDDSTNPRWIATVRGVGYRFIGHPDNTIRQGRISLAAIP